MRPTQPAALQARLVSTPAPASLQLVLEYSQFVTHLPAAVEAVFVTPGAPAEQMEREHCQSSDSMQVFETSNYGIDTRSDIEYYFVANPEEGKKLAQQEGFATSAERWWPTNRRAQKGMGDAQRQPIDDAAAKVAI